MTKDGSAITAFAKLCQYRKLLKNKTAVIRSHKVKIRILCLINKQWLSEAQHEYVFSPELSHNDSANNASTA